ncbi:class I SAM-dependent methyltransferase [Actinoplanes oblitus]|uniref:Class I SAM-dependent methyltransferase n=1 Tax=Actinoplanes oblitus TaxID=3040509 RepID=A0ABY8W4D2_9ACTN|nr:class I SAM-dependent methyltransferase [Actinoplanes oblitus]WIM92721.1 class I SAM-dependent methyltransferase [Actinoplanes oblitus]
MNVSDPAELVRRGYDDLSQRYRGDDDAPAEYAPWLDDLQRRLPARASVLDLGCGCGIPVAKAVAGHGHQVTGVDLSAVQIDRARRLVPQATFVQADATRVEFPGDSFDAVVCLYALIHMPLEAQPRLLQRIAGWLRPGGILLATTGAQEWTGTQNRWLGGTVPMWWSHADAATYREWIIQAGLHIESERFVPEGDSGHQLFWARRPLH